jgi:GWxTD domain-containing protein
MSAITVRSQQQTQVLGRDWYADDEWHLLVRYIITPQESGDYERLKSVSERDEFITRFWARRDPTPDTAVNEFHDEFDRRVAYANTHFADPNDVVHPGLDTDRGRIYVLFGAPASVTTFRTGAHEMWRYDRLEKTTGQTLTLLFSIPPIDSCDGAYRVVSPAPLASVTQGHTSVQVYPGRLVTARIAVDFTSAASVAHNLRTAAGAMVVEGDAAVWDGQFGPAGKDPMSRHILGCRLFESGGLGYTHPLPPGEYVFSSVVTMLDGAVRRDRVRFAVK